MKNQTIHLIDITHLPVRYNFSNNFQIRCLSHFSMQSVEDIYVYEGNINNNCRKLSTERCMPIICRHNSGINQQEHPKNKALTSVSKLTSLGKYDNHKILINAVNEFPSTPIHFISIITTPRPLPTPRSDKSRDVACCLVPT